MLKTNRIFSLPKLKSLISNKASYSSSLNAPNKSYPSEVEIVEVGPRDGLQNEKVRNYSKFTGKDRLFYLIKF